MMMTNSIQSELLTSYIKKCSATKTPVAENCAISNKTNEPGQDSFKKTNTTDNKNNKKGKIAKIALISSMILVSTIAVTTAFRHNGGVIKTLKDTGRKIKNLFKNDNNIKQNLQNAAENMNEYQKGADNITNGKDALTRHFLLKIPFYPHFDNATTNLYRKAMHSTCAKNAKKAANAFNEADDVISQVIKNSNADESVLKRAGELLTKKRQAVMDFCNPDNLSSRIKDLDKSMHRLDKEAWKNISEINSGNLREKTNYYSKTSLVKDGFKKAKESYSSVLQGFENGGLTKEEAIELDGILKNICKDNSECLSKMNKADKLFKTAFDKENIDLVQKLRDINCGSAPTDILGVLGTVGLLGLYTAQADTKEEKVSVSLTSGIPLIATLGTTLAATCKMVSGAKAIGLGLLTGFVSNKLGKIVDKKYQEANNIEDVPKTIVTLDDYTNSIKGATKDMTNILH